jgi:hypothetical protein
VEREQKPTWRLTIRPEGPGAPGIVRLRGCLKWLLRTWGLRCMSVEQVNEQKPAEVEEQNND